MDGSSGVPGRFTWARHLRDEGPKADVTVSATAAELYLLAWGRYKGSDDRYSVRGDQALLETWQRNSAV